MSVPNLKRIALFVQKLLGIPNFDPPQTPFPGAQHGQNLISWRRCLHIQTQFGENRCTQFRVIVVTDTHKHTNKHTYRQDRLQYTAPLSLGAQLQSLTCSVTRNQKHRPTWDNEIPAGYSHTNANYADGVRCKAHPVLLTVSETSSKSMHN